MPSRTRAIYFLIAAIAIAIACLLIVWSTLRPIRNPVLSVTTVINTVATSSAAMSNMHFDVVTDLKAQEIGLGGRIDIPADYGMLFVFPKDDNYGFWMKDMLVSIDIIWLSDNGTVIGIEDSVAPSTYPSVFYPPSPVRYVLETRAGEAKVRQWHVGSVIGIPIQK
jgi:uncharacterized membrane protein (UPF0127 family)